MINNHQQTGVEYKPLIVGTKRNHLTVIKFHHYQVKGKRTRGYFYYLCKCDCGKYIVVVKENLLQGETKSCGCHRARANSLSHRKEKYFSSMKQIFKGYKAKAKKRKLQFNLSLEEFKKISSQNCYYCGITPQQHNKSQIGHSYGIYKYNGLDRIDSNKGYNSDNCVACCKHCNFAKWDLSTNKFYKHIKKIYEHIKDRIKNE